MRTAPIGTGYGVFSIVVRVELDAGAAPASVVVKRPDPGPNGAAAATAGAYRREAASYRHLLPLTPVRAPRCHLVVDEGGDRASFVLEDLGSHRAVDQLDGLGNDDAVSVAVELARLHVRWRDDPALLELPVRRATPAALEPTALARGRRVVAERWADAVGDALPVVDRLLANRAAMVEAFTAAAPPTLCHGDPRADNLVFGDDGRPVLYDWQQVAVNFGEADLAWLAATSLEPDVRRRVERDLVAAHAAATGAGPAAAWDRYRVGMVLPALAVLLLAQREATSERAEALIATSLRRITAAVDDLDVASLRA